MCRGRSAVVAMAQIKSWKELADLGFVVAFRFYGRYPETGRSFYHPPPCESERAEPSTLAAATSLMLPTLSAPSLSVFFSTGPEQGLDGVLPSPAPQNVGAH